MSQSQPEVAGTVVQFVPRPRVSTYLTPVDRLEIARWREHVLSAGFDRVVVYEREPGDHADVGDFLALHRTGEAWAHYLFARRGPLIAAWCGVSGEDFGTFQTLRDAFAAVLPQAPLTDFPLPPAPNVVTDLMPRLRRVAAG